MDVLQSLFRWIHVVVGILWIGLLYFFNWVNGPFAATLDADSKKKVVPELMPRALHFFRWSAAFTWITGVLLLLIVFYHGGILFDEPTHAWNRGSGVIIALVFLAPFIYDALMKIAVLKKNGIETVVTFFVVVAAVIFLMIHWAGFGYRGYVIHTGAMLGTIMAFNVWFRIWPNQKKIITAVKNGEKPDADVVAVAGMRSKHNTYMSVPLVWTMLNFHTTWASSTMLYLLLIIFIGGMGVKHLYKHAGKVKGF